MVWKSLLFFLAVAPLCIQAQNLVPNPSFEDYGNAPCSWVISQETFDDAFNHWVMPTYGSTDLFTTEVDPSCYASCYSDHNRAPGYQEPRTGNAMANLWTYGTGCSDSYREYLEIELLNPLMPGTTYYAEFYVSRSDYTRYASNNLGMYFSDTFIYEPNRCTFLDLDPQINELRIVSEEDDWFRVSGRFIARSEAKYLLIGNFFDDEHTDVLDQDSGLDNDDARYFIDDILVVCESCLALDIPETGTKVAEPGYTYQYASQQGTLTLSLSAILRRKEV